MDSVELSRTTRWGMMFIGLLQGVVCYLLMTYLIPITVAGCSMECL